MGVGIRINAVNISSCTSGVLDKNKMVKVEEIYSLAESKNPMLFDYIDMFLTDF